MDDTDPLGAEKQHIKRYVITASEIKSPGGEK